MTMTMATVTVTAKVRARGPGATAHIRQHDRRKRVEPDVHVPLEHHVCLRAGEIIGTTPPFVVDSLHTQTTPRLVMGFRLVCTIHDAGNAEWKRAELAKTRVRWFRRHELGAMELGAPQTASTTTRISCFVLFCFVSLPGAGEVSAAQPGYPSGAAGVPQGEREPGERGRLGAGDL